MGDLVSPPSAPSARCASGNWLLLRPLVGVRKASWSRLARLGPASEAETLLDGSGANDSSEYGGSSEGWEEAFASSTAENDAEGGRDAGNGGAGGMGEFWACARADVPKLP
jgi:hypothetical protein